MSLKNINRFNSFIISSILVIFIVSFPSLDLLRVPLIILHITFFYFLMLYENKKIYFNTSVFIIFILIFYILSQSLILQNDSLSIVQAVAVTSFLFFTSQISLSEKSLNIDKDLKRLSKILLLLLPFFLLSFSTWSDYRKPGLFMNPNITSHLAVTLLPFIMLGSKKLSWKIIAFLIVLVISIVTASRSSLMALILSSITYIVIIKLPKAGFFTLFFSLCSSILISLNAVNIAIWIFNSLTNFFSSSNSRLFYTGYNSRDILLDHAIERFESQPYLGLGFDGTKFEIDGHLLSTHNGLIDILLKFGIVGTLIFTVFFINLIWMTSKQSLRFKASTMMSLTVILSLSTNSSTFFVLNYLFIYSILLVYLGFSIRSSRKYEPLL